MDIVQSSVKNLIKYMNFFSENEFPDFIVKQRYFEECRCLVFTDMVHLLKNSRTKVTIDKLF